MHAIHVLKCFGMFRRNVWNQCVKFPTENDRIGLVVSCRLGFHQGGMERERPWG